MGVPEPPMGGPGLTSRHEAKNAPQRVTFARLEGGMKPGDSKDETGVKRLIRICRGDLLSCPRKLVKG